MDADNDGLVSKTGANKTSMDMKSLVEPPNSTILGTRDEGRVEFEGARGEVWLLLLIVMSSVNMTVTLVYQVVIVCRASRSSPSRRHLFLSQALLLGLLLGSSLGFVHSLDQTIPTCVAIRLGTGLSYVLIYSSLLVKQVFLISLNTGVYLPAMYQALLFFFCVLVQLVIGVQWVVVVPDCSYTTSDHILSLSYIIFLVTAVSILAMRSKHIRENYREGRYIFLLMVVHVPLWACWLAAALLLPHHWSQPVQGLGLVSICLVTFLIMFLPRPRQLTALGKEGVYLEDQQEASISQRQDMPYIQAKRRRARGDSQEQEEVYQQAGSYLGFHRPLGVVPPSSSPPSHTPVYTLPPTFPPSQPSPPHFPSHFYPDKLYQYWHHYYPRLPPYQRLDHPMPGYRRERSPSRSPASRPSRVYREPSPLRSYYAYY